MSSKLSPEERIEALRALNERFAKTLRPELTGDEEDASVDEAMQADALCSNDADFHDTFMIGFCASRGIDNVP